ncbi:U3 small nucleolar RNA-associated protein [Linderina macrospora]|uniref:U3 small nucleolar RNA-associated protein n=1 Tax=Linderina macrospora TaxID=4868 RepID=A0ACC1J8Y8_9FUNG|nr:U3 small nucleolar RNA-associated protein [Linderina macrospora]
MATNHAQTQLAVGTEDGHIRIFDIVDDGLAYVRCFDRVKSRILSVAWGADDSTVVTGSADGSVRVWGTDGHVETRMTVPKEGADATLVWAVAVLRDGTIVSGDSRGHVVFWDGAMRVVRQDFKALGADVLSLAADRAGHTVYAAGVDPKITQFRLFAGGAEAARIKSGSAAARKWQLTGFRRYHTHDVRALALETSKAVNLLASGGVDAQVTAARARSFPDRAPQRQPCFPPLGSAVSVASAAGLVLQCQGTQLKIWALGQSEPLAPALAEHMESGQAVHVREPPRDLLRIDVKARTALTCSAISASGKFVLASDAEGPKLFHIAGIAPGCQRVRVRRVRCFPPADFVPADSANRGIIQARFTADESRIVMATADAYVSVVDISKCLDGDVTTLVRLCAHRCTDAETAADSMAQSADGVLTLAGRARKQAGGMAALRTIVHMSVSHDDSFVATADSAGTVAVARLDGSQQTVVPRLGRHGQASVTAVGFSRRGHVMLATSDNRVYAWDVNAQRLTAWSQQFSDEHIPRPFREKTCCVAGFAANASEPDCVYAWAENHITRIDLSQAPGPRETLLNIHKRKQIEHEIIEKVVEEKDVARRRLERQLAKRASKQQNASLEPSMQERAARLEKDWEETVVARLREAGIDVRQPNNFRMTQRYQGLMAADFAADDAMVVVERPWIDVAASLPPAYHRRRFGQ